MKQVSKEIIKNIFSNFKETWGKDIFSLFVSALGLISGIINLWDKKLEDLINHLFETVLNFLNSVIGKAHAADAAIKTIESIPSSSTTSLNTLFTIGCFVAFFWAFIVSIHNDSPEKRQAAKGHANLFAGILIGSAKGTLGL